MPLETNEELLQAAFLGPIRTVVIIDDEFPTYGRLATCQAQPHAVGIADESHNSNSRNDVALPTVDIAESQSAKVDGDNEDALAAADVSDESSGEKKMRAVKCGTAG